MKKILLTGALLSGALAFAGGFRVSLQGVKQLAMAHTSAHAEDASVAFFNPAGISFIPNKLSVVAGGFAVQSHVEFQNVATRYTAETDNPTGTPIYAAIAYKINKNISVGASLTTPFGSTVEWPTNWEGKEMVQRMELKSFFIQPMISVKLADWVSLGGGFIYAKGLVDWTKAITQLDGTLNIKDEKAQGYGANLGFYFQPDEKWDVSVAYRSPVNMKAEHGMATFNVSKSLYSVLGINENGQDSFTATLPLVDEFTFGATYKVTPKWLLSADFNYHGWEKYDKLVLDFANAKVGNQTSDNTILSTPKNFKNSKTFRFGTQYAFTNNFFGRLGYYYDEAPYTDKNFIAETPSFDANVVTGGFGYRYKGLGIDVAAGYNMGKARSVNNKYYNFTGQARSHASYVGVGLSYNAF